MMTFFKNDDLGYQNWLRDNQTGYVFNDFRGTNSTYKTLHTSGCKLLRSPASVLFRTNILKVCSIDLDELIDWLDQNRGPEDEGYFPCESCRPFCTRKNLVDDIWDSRPTEIIWR